MRLILQASIAGSLMAISSALAVPARPLYVPATRSRPLLGDLAGTVWLGKYLTNNRTYIFEADGTVSYKSTAKTGKIFKNRGHWRVEGGRLIFDHNAGGAKLFDFVGAIQDGDAIAGEATYRVGNRVMPMFLLRTTLPLK